MSHDTPTRARALELAHDLFPETLLVQQGEGGRLYTTSLVIAQYTGKRHHHVLRAIERVKTDVPQPFWETNFGLSNRLVRSGRRTVKAVKYYELTEEGFALSMMSFTGSKAARWKVAFIEAFQTMRAALAAENDRWQTAFDRLHPRLRPVVEGTMAGYSRAIIAAPLAASVGSITYHRRRARQLGLLH